MQWQNWPMVSCIVCCLTHTVKWQITQQCHLFLLWTWKWGNNNDCSPPPGSSDCRWFSWAQPVTWRVLTDDEINKCYFPSCHQAGQVRLCLVLPGDDWQLLLRLLPLPNTMFVPIISRLRGKRAGSDCTDYFSSHSNLTRLTLSDITIIFLRNVLLWRPHYSTGWRELVNSLEPSYTVQSQLKI